MKKFIPVIIVAFLYGCGTQTPEIKLASLISNHMVLQQNMNVPLWGNTTPGVTIEAKASWGAAGKIKSDTAGNWKIVLNTPPAGGPYTITFTARKTQIVVEDVYIGEVWLCSGQSNMEMPLKGWPPRDTVNNYQSEISNAQYPEIRMFTVEKNLSFNPLSECKGSWAVCSPETTGDFSATAYFFGRDLYKKLGVPIGLIHTSWGGTPAESWTSPDRLINIEGFEKINEKLSAAQASLDNLNNWLASLENIDQNSLPSEKPFAGVKLNDNEYAGPEYNDSSWNTMELPGLWESKGLPAFDGIVWFRKEFELPKNLYPEGFDLYLGPVDDMDAVYINGIKIGGIEEYNVYKTERIYSIPQSALKEGKNNIAVRVIDLRGGGGIYGKNISIKKGEKEVLNLNGSWKYLPTVVAFGGKLYKFSAEEKNISNMPRLSVPYDANTPGILYNAMIVPVVPYAIKGAIWYQGESNVDRAMQYRKLFPEMINNWREIWQQGDFPFYFVQIAPYNYGDAAGEATSELREAQTLTMKVNNTGMIVTMDIGNPANIHPSYKQEVGQRLASWALTKDYSVIGIQYSGPLYKSVSFDGNKAIIEFEYADSLICKSDKLNFFEIADTTGKYFPADAKIEGNKVIVSSTKVKVPATVRYAWDDDVEPKLFNSAGLPASPFRTNP